MIYVRIRPRLYSPVTLFITACVKSADFLQTFFYDIGLMNTPSLFPQAPKATL